MHTRYLFILLFASTITHAQLGFFEDYWMEETASLPEYEDYTYPLPVPQHLITIDPSDTIIKISPYIGGYDLNQFFGGKIYDKPGLLEHIKNLNLPYVRWPGGSGSNITFWDAAKPDKPSDVDSYIDDGEVKTNIKWGDEPGTDYLSLDNYYNLRDSISSQGMNVVNYSYARYGRSPEPVKQAAHYAADWVRYDNGRTLFWEIGNEHYGRWEAGYRIDTNLNQDGQPEYLTGSLYAAHCKVFIDSMRAAAAEIGAEIRIGAVIGFSTSHDTWNKEVISSLKNIPDFYILHKYYGNWEDRDAAYILGTFQNFYDDKAYIDGLIQTYCDPLVPLIHSEWNTRFSGRGQNVSCTNGLFTLQGFKGIINTGIGCSSRWNLIWGYNDGDTHGLITNSKDNPGIEGIPSFTPRAPYFYIYFFRKFLGDVSTNNTSEHPEVDVFSSSFSSGQTSFVLLNKGNDTRKVAVNIKNFNEGDRYYWYTLTAKGNDPFSPEVLINGIENTSYEAGGPANYSDIKAWAALLSEGVELVLPPWSATLVLCDGMPEIEEDLHPVDLTIYGRSGAAVAGLQGAAIYINNSIYISDSQGKLLMNLPAGTHDYTIRAEGHTSVSGNIQVPELSTLTDTLDIEKYTIGFRLYYAEDSSEVEHAILTFDAVGFMEYNPGNTLYINDVSHGEHTVQIISNSAGLTFTEQVVADSVYTLYIEKPTHVLGIACTEMYSNRALSAVNIEIDNGIKTTDLDGEASFSLKQAIYEYTISRDGYESITGSIDLLKDSILSFTLKPLLADAKFKLYKEGTPVKDAEVIIDTDTVLSNNLGISLFAELTTEAFYTYAVQKAGFIAVSGDFHLRVDTIIQVDMTEEEVGYSLVSSHPEIEIYPNPATTVLHIQSKSVVECFRIYSITGEEVLRYEAIGRKNTVIDISLLKSGLYIMRVEDKEMKTKQFTFIKDTSSERK
ncbi:T9SS type A sorting domain-containing protein [Bacteroidota bacterium]